MLEFKVIKEIKPNKEILDIITNYDYKVVKGKIKIIKHTNLQVIKPAEYHITFPFVLTIFYYEVNEINNKPFYIKEYNQKYSLKEIKNILKKLN